MIDYETTSTSFEILTESDPPRPEGRGWRLVGVLPWGGLNGHGAVFYWERPVEGTLLTERV